MKFSEAWLREWANPSVDTQTLVSQLTMAGLEVDAVEPVAGEFNNVVVGEIVERAQHPDADRLSVCKVNVGEAEPLQIVCGAKNAREGIRIPCATIGAVLPGNFKIKKSKLRGVESYGMLCAGTELGLEEESDGLLELPLDAPVGQNIRDYLDLNDQIIDVDLTPNRGDCLSIAGVAREVGVINQCAVTPVAIEAVPASNDDVVSVDIEAADACPVYASRVINGVNTQAATPLWMVERLRRSGICSLGVVVDVTNYLLLELGQPMHAFDKAKLQGGIRVRFAAADEPLKLLDGSEIKLSQEVLVIADAQAPVAFAGVMGGDASAVSDSTQDIVLEAAHFDKITIAGKARAFGLHTDSSHRFERGVDPKLPAQAIERATQLILEIAGGEAGPTQLTGAGAEAPSAIQLKRASILRLLGIELADDTVVDILQRLDMQVEANDDGWLVTAPSCRFDMEIEADLIEELARIVGYDKLPVVEWAASMQVRDVDEAQADEADVKNRLVARGYQEAITYSFVAKDLLAKYLPAHDPIMLANPISADMAAMRTSLLPGLVSTLESNLNRQAKRVRLFETGLRFRKGEGEAIAQTPMIAGLIYGVASPEQWCDKPDNVDFFDIKADVEALLGENAANASWAAAEHPMMHPGQCAELTLGGESIGYVGAMHPSHVGKLGPAPMMFELSLAAVEAQPVPAFEPLSKFQANRRDLALLVKESIPAQALIETINGLGNSLITETFIFDVYQGQGIDSGFKSVALAVVLQDKDATLVDEQVDAAIAQIAQALNEQHAATIRD